MTTASVSRRAHLETVIEFEIEPDPVATPPLDLGERAVHVRRLVGVVGAAVGVVVAGAIGAGIATSPPPPAPPAHAVRTQSLAHAPTSCRPTATTATRPGEPHVRCTVPVSTSPSAEVAMRSADDAALARARAWAQTHGPGTGTSRRGGALDWPAASERIWTP